MVMRRVELTSREVAALAKRPGLHWVSANLYLDATDGLSWAFRYMIDGRARSMGLGPYPRVTLAGARARADHAWKIVDAGADPIEERRARKVAMRLERAAAMTFRQAAEACIKARAPGWRNAKHASQWPITLATYAYPIIGDLPVQAVDVGLTLKVLEPIWTVKPETASRVRGRIETVLDWATARGYRQGENPARWRGHLENLLAQKAKVRRVKHHAALPYANLPDFMSELKEHGGVAARAFEFLILNVSRSSEVLLAPWSELNLAERLWVIPGERMKGGREHRVPLTDRSIEVLLAMAKIRESSFVFPGGKAGRPLSHMALRDVLRRMGRADLTVHGFRATFSTWCAERTNFPVEARELALAHEIGSKVAQAYARSDLFNRRRLLAQAWVKFCSSAPAAGEVVPLTAGAGRS